MSKKDPTKRRRSRESKLLQPTTDTDSRTQYKKRQASGRGVRFVSIVLGWGRFRRILFVGFASLMVALAVGVLFYAFDNRFLIPEDGETITFMLYIPVIASTIMGLVWYVLGWVYVVSPYTLEESAPNIILWYLGITLIAFAINLAWLANVIAVLGSPTG